MKKQVTRKNITNYYSRIYWAGYCELYPLYQSCDAVGYNAGVYGWNYDLYVIGGCAITSGYRGMFGGDLPERAKKILNNAKKQHSKYNGMPWCWDKQKAYLKRARRAFEKALREG